MNVESVLPPSPNRHSFKRTRYLMCGFLAGIAIAPWITGHFTTPKVAAAEAAQEQAGLDKLQAEIEELKGRLPDQSHAMSDVGYHFSNLWFAAEHKNWALADFYLAETRSHLKWAVRILPVRHTKAGDVDLNGILEAVDGSLLAAVKDSIDKQDGGAFVEAYRQTVEGCYACHKASEKPFLRLQVPDAPPAHILNLDPAADWPQ